MSGRKKSDVWNFFDLEGDMYVCRGCGDYIVGKAAKVASLKCHMLRCKKLQKNLKDTELCYMCDNPELAIMSAAKARKKSNP